MRPVFEKFGEALRIYLKAYPEKSTSLLKVETALLYMKSINALRNVVLTIIGAVMLSFMGVLSFFVTLGGVLTQIHWGSSALGYQLILVGALGMLLAGLGLFRAMSSRRWMELTNGDQVLDATFGNQRKTATH